MLTKVIPEKEKIAKQYSNRNKYSEKHGKFRFLSSRIWFPPIRGVSQIISAQADVVNLG